MSIDAATSDSPGGRRLTIWHTFVTTASLNFLTALLKVKRTLWESGHTYRDRNVQPTLSTQKLLNLAVILHNVLWHTSRFLTHSSNFRKSIPWLTFRTPLAKGMCSVFRGERCARQGQMCNVQCAMLNHAECVQTGGTKCVRWRSSVINVGSKMIAGRWAVGWRWQLRPVHRRFKSSIMFFSCGNSSSSWINLNKEDCWFLLRNLDEVTQSQFVWFLFHFRWILLNIDVKQFGLATFTLFTSFDLIQRL